jgi:hypothetical protein
MILNRAFVGYFYAPSLRSLDLAMRHLDIDSRKRREVTKAVADMINSIVVTGT